MTVTRSSRRRASEPLENLVVLSIDSLRADHCGFMGCDRGLTPTLDRLASEGVVYERAIAPGPRTPSSMPVAFTDHFDTPQMLSWGDWEERRARIRAHMRRHRTLAECLQDAGYTTIGITANPWTHGIGFDQGFDRFLEITGQTITSNGNRAAPIVSSLDAVLSRTGFGEKYKWHVSKDWLVQWPHYYDIILNELDQAAEPWFLWVFLLDPHQPYLASRHYREESSLLGMYYANVRESTGDVTSEKFPSHVKRSLRRAYRDAIRSTDGFVSRLLDDLETEPSVVVHADHGEAFGEHGTWGHREQLYQENLHVPLVVHDGRRTGRITDLVPVRSLRDIVTDVIFEPDTDADRYSRETVMAATEGLEKVALLGERWKIIDDGDQMDLFDLDTDPGETVDVSAQHPDIVARLQRLLNRQRNHAFERVHIAEAIQKAGRWEGG